MSMSNRAIMAKDAITSEVFSGTGGGGYLNPEQSREFLRMMYDATDFTKDIMTYMMTSHTKDLDYMGLNSRVLRLAKEGVAPDELVGINTAKQTLSVSEVVLPYDLTDNSIEDNIEGKDVDAAIAEMMTEQFGNDLCDLSINGNATVSDSDPDAKFLKIGDGFIKIAKGSMDTHKVDIEMSQDYKGMIFPNMLRAMPNRFKRRKSELRYYVSPSVAEAYTQQLAIRETDKGDEALIEGTTRPFSGIKLFECEYMPDNVIILTSKKNLAMGVLRQIQKERQRQARKRLTEYTITMRIDPAKIIWHDALVIGYKM